jgi:hypothetical protein
LRAWSILRLSSFQAASPGKADTRMAYGNAERTPEEAADGFVWLVTLPDDGPSGCLFDRREQLDW